MRVHTHTRTHTHSTRTHSDIAGYNNNSSVSKSTSGLARTFTRIVRNICKNTHTRTHTYTRTCISIVLLASVVIVALVVVAFRWQTKDADSVRFFFIDAATFSQAERG